MLSTGEFIDTLSLSHSLLAGETVNYCQHIENVKAIGNSRYRNSVFLFWKLIMISMCLFYFQHRKYIFLVYHTAALFAILGVRPALFVLCNCVIVFATAWCGSVILVWTVSIALIAFLNYDPYTAHGDFGFHPLVIYLLLYSVTVIILRNMIRHTGGSW